MLFNPAEKIFYQYGRLYIINLRASQKGDILFHCILGTYQVFFPTFPLSPSVNLHVHLPNFILLLFLPITSPIL